jgi:ribosomal protein S18 acetylase RimI-like enzyme
MATERELEPGMLDTDSILVRTMRAEDLDAIVAIDTLATGRRRPSYFDLMLERAIRQARLQISLVAELEGRVVGFLIGSLYYGEYGIVEPTASVEGIGVDPHYRGHRVGKAMMRQLRINLGALQISTLRTEVDWDDLDLVAFFKSEGFSPSQRLCLETSVDLAAPHPSCDTSHSSRHR